MEVSMLVPQRDAAALSALVHRIYEAGTRPENWPAVVEAIALSTGCTKGLLFTPFVAPQDGGLTFAHGIGESSLQLWASKYIDHDIWSRQVAVRGMLDTGNVLIDSQMVPHEEFLASTFYREFLCNIGIARVCAGVVFGNEPGLPATSLSVYRDIDDPPFDEADAEWMRLLLSHVSRSLGIMLRLETLQSKEKSLLSSFDRLAAGVVLLDGDMRVIHANAAAQAVLNRQDGLAISADNRLESTCAPQRALPLSHWLDTVRAAPPTKRMHFLDGCVVPRRNAGSHYVVQCSALANAEWSGARSDMRYIAFITDPAALRLPDVERLMNLYGLTRTQARVALAFASGASYKDTARSLAISEETVRSHVKEIYPKTRVNRQADLIRLVLSLGQSGI